MFPQEVLINRLGNPSKGSVPLIQEHFKLLVVRALHQVNVLRTVVGPKFLTGLVVLMDNQEQLSASDGTTHGLLLSGMPNEFLLDPGLVHSVAVSSNTQRFRELRVKAPILAARIGHSSHSRVAMGRGLDPIPDLVTSPGSGHDSISKTATPLRILGNRLQGFKFDLPSLCLVLTTAFLSTTTRRSPSTVRVIPITATTAPTSPS